MSLYTKDFLRVSDYGFSFLKKQLDASIPSLHTIKKIRSELNKNFEIEKLGDGCLINPKIAITEKLKTLYGRSPSIFEDNRIKVKLSADGTNISRKIKILNVIFSVINEDIKAATASGSYLFALAPYEKENYDEITPLMARTWDLIKGFNEIHLENVVKYIDLFVCADYKMNLNLAGLKNANSMEPCLYCTAAKKHLHDIGKYRRVLVDETLTVLEDGKKLCEILDEDFQDFAVYDFINNEKESHWIHSDKMLLKLPIFRFIIDLLHLFLRISDKLFVNLIEQIKIIDNFSDNYNPKKHKNITILISYLKECRIPINESFYNDNLISKIFTSLQGPDRLKLFNRLDKDDSFLLMLKSISSLDKYEDIYTIWKDFYSLLKSIKSDQPPDLDISQAKINNWFRKYVQIYTKDKVTPYIHMFNYHLIDQFKKYGNINFFSTQGLEKLNDLSTQNFFKSTNKKDYCYQILQRSMRMDYLDSLLKLKPKVKYPRKLDAESESYPKNENVDNNIDEKIFEIDDETDESQIMAETFDSNQNVMKRKIDSYLMSDVKKMKESIE